MKLKTLVIVTALAGMQGCSAMAGLASTALGVGGTPPIDVTAQVGAENESNKLKLSNDSSTRVDEVGRDMVNTTTITMAWWMIVLVWLSGIVVNPSNLRGYFNKKDS